MTAALLALALAQDAAEFVRRLRSDDPDVRERATWGLEDLGEAARPELEKAASDPDREVASRAQFVLRMLPLRARFTPDFDRAWLRRLAAGDAHAWTEVFLEATDADRTDRAALAPAAIRGASGPEERGVVARRAAESRLRTIVPVLIELLSSESEVDRGTGSDHLKCLRAREVSPQLIALLRGERAEVRLAAADVLANLRTPEGLRAVVESIRSEPRVAGFLRDRAVIPYLIPLLEETDPKLRGIAVDLLCDLGARKAGAKIAPLLRDDDVAVRLKAVAALDKLDARDVARDLLPLLDDPSTAVRCATVQALARLGARDGIAARLRDSEWSVRVQAAAALAALRAREAAPEILALLEDDSFMVRCAALDSLAELGVASPRIADRLQDTNSDVRRQAARSLANLRDRTAVEALIPLLDDPDDGVRSAAIDAAAALEARETVPRLIEALDDGDAWVRWTAANALAALGATEAIPALIERLQHEDIDGKATLMALSRLGAREAVPAILDAFPQMEARKALVGLNAREVIPDLVKLIESEDGAVRWAAEQTLEEMKAVEAVPELAKLLTHDEPIVRRNAAGTLLDLGTPEALAAVAQRAVDSNEQVRGYAVRALRLTEPDRIAAFLEDPSSVVRSIAAEVAGLLQLKAAAPRLRAMVRTAEGDELYYAIRSLGELGAKEALPEICRRLDDDLDWTRAAAAHAVGLLGGEAERILPLLDDPSAWVRSAAAEAIGKLGARGAVPQLLFLLGDGDSSTVDAAAVALGRLGAREAVPQLVDVLDSGRASAQQALGMLEAVEAVPDLLPLLGRRDSYRRKLALEALGRIGAREAAGEIAALLEDEASRWDAVRALERMEATEIVPKLEALLGREDADLRYAAASALCRLGSSKGIPVLLEKGRLFDLNAVREPGMWARLNRTPLTERFTGTIDQALGTTATVEVPEDLRARRVWRDPEFHASLLDVVRECEKDENTSVILEPDRIRFVPRAEALKFWTAWAKKRR